MAQKLAIYALVAIALLVCGFGAGWHAKGVSVTAALAKAAQADSRAVVADVARQAQDLHAHAVAEQGKTAALNTKLTDIRVEASTLDVEIAHARLEPPPPAAGEPAVCADPVGGAEFLRLYNAAARGGAPAAASTAAGGVHGGGV
ncbi:hypothetical protein [Rhodanobacter lindaniclasticus]|jgi:hypothetical protein